MVYGGMSQGATAFKKSGTINLKTAVNMVQGDEFAKVLEKDALTLGSETMLRGSEVNTMMQSGGYTFSNTNPDPKHLLKMDKTGPAESLYDLSSDVSEIDAFVSHSWRDGQILKFLSLALYFRAWNSIVWALLPTIPAIVLQWYFGTTGHLPAIYMGQGIYSNGLAHMVWSLSFVYFLLRGAPTPFRPIYCFLDRLCIHQTDPRLMRKGIDSLGGFLAHSKKMVVIYSSNYITRLWCCFELAAKVRTHGTEAIDLMPIAVCGAVGAPCVTCMLASMGLSVAAACGFTAMIGAPNSLMESPMVLFMMPAFILNTYLPLKMATELQDALQTTEAELTSLEVQKLQCSVERDRAFVEGCIRRWYGSDAAFERTVREDLVNKLRRDGVLRKVPCFTYKQALTVFFHSAIMWLDMVTHTATSVNVQALPLYVIKTAALQPLSLAAITLGAYCARQARDFARAKIHSNFPALPFFAVAYVFGFVAGAMPLGVIVPGAGDLSAPDPVTWALPLFDKWVLVLPFLYVTFLVYRVRLPGGGTTYAALGALSALAVAYLASQHASGAPPLAACHWKGLSGCVPSNEATASCRFAPLSAKKCVGVAA